MVQSALEYDPEVEIRLGFGMPKIDIPARVPIAAPSFTDSKKLLTEGEALTDSALGHQRLVTVMMAYESIAISVDHRNGGIELSVRLLLPDNGIQQYNSIFQSVVIALSYSKR